MEDARHIWRGLAVEPRVQQAGAPFDGVSPADFSNGYNEETRLFAIEERNY